MSGPRASNISSALRFSVIIDDPHLHKRSDREDEKTELPGLRTMAPNSHSIVISLLVEKTWEKIRHVGVVCAGLTGIV